MREQTLQHWLTITGSSRSSSTVEVAETVIGVFRLLVTHVTKKNVHKEEVRPCIIGLLYTL